MRPFAFGVFDPISLLLDRLQHDGGDSTVSELKQPCGQASMLFLSLYWAVDGAVCNLNHVELASAVAGCAAGCVYDHAVGTCCITLRQLAIRAFAQRHALEARRAFVAMVV